MSGEVPPLRIDWCSHEAAKYAVEHWHYSRTMPASKTVKVGVWEHGQFIGVVIFSRGSCPSIGKPFGLTQTECCELTRVALAPHATPTTRILAIALRMLRRQSPDLRLVISYADCDQGHHGGIYAGGGWLYIGKVQLDGGTPCWKIHGRKWHARTITARGWSASQEWLRANIDPHAEPVYTTGKHKYLFPLAEQMRWQLLPLVQPYPKRAGSADGGTATDQVAGGGSTPTSAL